MASDERGLELDSLLWNLALADSTPDQLRAALTSAREQLISARAALAKVRMVIGGVEVWAANLPYTLTSDAGHLMCEGGEPFAACYWDTPEGRVFSLRSRDDGADVAAIAARYGGGGHKHASGFRLPHGVQP